MNWTDRLLFFPLKPRSKEPATPHGHLDAKPIGEWTVKAANWGIRCGPESGITVIDVDPRNGGDVNAILPLLPSAPRVKTGGGGWHFYCQCVPPRTKFAKIPGIDFKNNGYVVSPGSIHPSGNPYTWEQEGDLPPFPVQFVLTSSSPLPFSSSEPVDVVSITSALSALESDDYHPWVTIGMALHSTGLPEARKIWDDWSKKSRKFNPAEQEKKWKSFNADGSVTIGTLFHLAKEAGWSRLESVEDRPYKLTPPAEIIEPEDIPFSPRIPVPILEDIRQWFAPASDPVAAIVGALSIASLKFARTARTTKGDIPVLYFGLVGPTGAAAIPLASSIERFIRSCHLTWLLRGGTLSSEEKLKRALLHSSVLFHFSHAWASNVQFSYRQPSGAMAQALRTLELIFHGANLLHESEKLKEEPTWIFSPAVSLVAGIGEKEFSKIFSDDEMGRGTHEIMLYVPLRTPSDNALSDPDSRIVDFLKGDPLTDAQPPESSKEVIPSVYRIDDSDFQAPSAKNAFGGYRRIARRIALLLTLSRNSRASDVAREDLEWSFRFVTWCAQKLEDVETGGTGKATLYSRILEYIVKKGKDGASQREIVQHIRDFKSMMSDQRDELLMRMQEDGEIERRIPEGKKGIRFYAAKFIRKESSHDQV